MRANKKNENAGLVRSYVYGRAVVIGMKKEDGIIRQEGPWRYEDTGEERSSKKVDWPCPKCGLLPTVDGEDPCIAKLPGVTAACCGHGVMKGYVAFDSGIVIRGEFDHIKEETGGEPARRRVPNNESEPKRRRAPDQMSEPAHKRVPKPMSEPEDERVPNKKSEPPTTRAPNNESG